MLRPKYTRLTTMATGTGSTVTLLDYYATGRFGDLIFSIDARVVDEENAGKVIDVVISDVDTVRPTTIMIRMVGLTAHSDRKLWLQAGEKMNISLRDPDTSGIARVTVVSVPINTLKELNEVCLNL